MVLIYILFLNKLIPNKREEKIPPKKEIEYLLKFDQFFILKSAL